MTEQVQDEGFCVFQADLLDNAYESIIAWDLSGSIVYWNYAAEELFGFSRAQAFGNNIHRLLQTVHPIPLEEIIGQLQGQSVWSGELDYFTSDGLEVTIESHLKLIRRGDGKDVVLQSDRDVNVHKQAEAAMRQVLEETEQHVKERTYQLAEANRELESFSYSVSHDLRAPLRALEGFTRILSMDYAGKVLDDRAFDLMRRMTASVTRMGQLIEDLLNLSQVSRTTIHPQSLDFSALAKAVLDDLSSRDPERKVDIHIEPDMTLVADPGLLRLALENLLGNAWKFTGKTAVPQIAVGALRTTGQPVSYFIQDNGAGFDMEFADQLFAPFQRLHGATEFEGTGIGLATVHRVIHRHAGRVWAESTPGQGAKFYFTFGVRPSGKGK